MHFEGFLRDTNERSLALRLVLSLTLQPGFALDMTRKHVTAFQASKVRVIESVTVSFDLSLGMCACAMWNTCTDLSLSPLLWVFMHYFGRLCLNYPGLKYCHISNNNKKKKQQECLVCVKDSLYEIQTPITPHFSNGGFYRFGVPEFERRSAVAGVLTEMAASGHRAFSCLTETGGALTSQTSLPSLHAQTWEIERIKLLSSAWLPEM